MKRTAPLLALSLHEQKYDGLAEWLGVKVLQSLVPFSQTKVDRALANGDQLLHTFISECLGSPAWFGAAFGSHSYPTR